jgi:hypothetical protein
MADRMTDKESLEKAIDAYARRLGRLTDHIITNYPGQARQFAEVIEAMSDDLAPYEETFGIPNETELQP